jgi:hypothetical protein
VFRRTLAARRRSYLPGGTRPRSTRQVTATWARVAGVLLVALATLAPDPATAAGPAVSARRPTRAPAALAVLPGEGPRRLATTGRLSGLPWLSGVHTSNEVQPFLGFGAWRGRPLDLAVVYPDREDGWGPLVEPGWPVDQFAGFPGTLVISEPLYPAGQGTNAACATGAYDNQWLRLGTFLVGRHRAASIIRVGWEFNGLFNYWHADPDPTDFVLCFRRVVTAIRSTDPAALIDWTFNAHTSPVPAGGTPWPAYPGDQYVDFVGIDSYDLDPPSPDPASFAAQCRTPNGLCVAAAFARAHGRKLAVGEWGVVSCRAGGGGDNATYVDQMWATFLANADVLGYEAYFSDPAAGNVCSTLEPGGYDPRAGAEYRRLYGGPMPVG